MSNTSINIIPNNNQVILLDNNKSITIIDNNHDTQTVVTQPLTNVIQVIGGGVPGPPGATGASGSSAPFTYVSGNTWSTTSSIEITGSLTISGSITSNSFTGSLQGTSSYALTASVALNANFDSGSLVTTSSFNSFTGSYNTGSFTGSLTGSLQGTSSYALTSSYVLSSSFASTASYVAYQNFATFTQSPAATTWSFSHNLNNQHPIITIWNDSNEIVIPEKIQGTSLNLSTIYFPIPVAGFASATVGSILTTGTSSESSSFALTAISASYARTSSFINPLNQDLIITGSINAVGITSSLLGTSSFSINSISASYSLTSSFLNPLTQTLHLTGSSIISGSQIITGSIFILQPSQSNLPTGSNYTDFSVIGQNKQWSGSNIASGSNFVWNEFQAGTASFTSSSLIDESIGMLIRSPRMGTNATASLDLPLVLRFGTGTSSMKIGGAGGGNQNYIWINKNAPSVNNFLLQTDSNNTTFGTINQYSFTLNGSTRFIFNGNSATWTNTTAAGQGVVSYTFNGGATSNLISTNTPLVNFQISGVGRTWQSGSFTSPQIFTYLARNTASFTSSSLFSNIYNLFVEDTLLTSSATASNNWAIGTSGSVQIKNGNLSVTGSVLVSGSINAPSVINPINSITAVANAATVPITYRLSEVTNNSAATLTITIETTNAVGGQLLMVNVLDFSAVAQTITWVNTENSSVSVPTTSNGSTTLPLIVGFMYNSLTSKWRCIASA